MIGVPYLEVNDINPDASLKQHVTQNRPTVVLVYGGFCGYCRAMMPDFQNLCRRNRCRAVAVKIDGDEGDKAVAEILKTVNTSPGVPAILGFNGSGKFVKIHDGQRNVEAMEAFASSL